MVAVGAPLQCRGRFVVPAVVVGAVLASGCARFEDRSSAPTTAAPPSSTAVSVPADRPEVGVVDGSTTTTSVAPEVTPIGPAPGPVDAPDSSGPGTVPPVGSAPVCTGEPSRPTTHQYADRPGVDPDLTSVDVHRPTGCGTVPVIVWVHGGGWRRGDKASGFVERKAAWAASLGAALVSVNYRLSTPESGVVWPDHGDDVAAAVAWLQREGPGLGLDPTSVTLLGHSAGAHLVAIVGTDPTLLRSAGADPAAVSCVVPLDFSFDLAEAPAEEMIEDAFGDDPAVIAAASPNVAVERNGPPSSRFLVGTRGGAGRVADARSFVDQIVVAGGSARLLVANPYSHNQISSQLGVPGESIVTPPVTGFVRSCL